MTQAELDAKGDSLYRRAKSLIPGGTQLLSKRPEMFLPEQWPSYYSRAKGHTVWDLDGRPFVDMSYNGIGACVLGHADDDVDNAVRAAIDAGAMSTLNAPEEVELAEVLVRLHPWAEMVRYARTGGEAMAQAVRIARAHTRRDIVAFCGYHGWHDWYLAANLADDDALDGHLLPGLHPRGVPRGLKGTALPFHYNRLDELEEIVAAHPERLAAIVMEPRRDAAPVPGFLEGARRLADATGAVLVFDEITSGFRLNTGGIHQLLGVQPDIAVFAKALGNGYPMAAILGRASVMDAAQSSFISSTNWTERIGPTAAIATLRKHEEQQVPHHLIALGRRVKAIWQEAAGQYGLDVHTRGLDPLAHFSFAHPKAAELHTLYTQVMLERGYLASKAFYATHAHDMETVDAFASAVTSAFKEIGDAVAADDVLSRLKGPVAHSGFARLT